MTDATDGLVYRNRLSTVEDKWLFLAVLLCGFAGIFVLKLLGYPQLVITAWPVGCMLLYLAVVLLQPAFRLRDDQTADNFYYLGFLYTLGSLAMALWRFLEGDGAETVLESFGIALATTILGLAIRVFLGQFRRDPVQFEREARLALADTATRLRAELDGAVLEFNSFRRATQQAIAEGFAEATAQAQSGLEESTRAVGETAHAAVQWIERATAEHAEQARQFGQMTAKAGSALDKLARRVDQIEAPKDLLAQRLAPTIAALEQAAEAVRARSAAMDGAATVLERASRAADVFTRQAEIMAAQAGEVNATAARLTALQGEIDAAAGSLRAAANEQAELLAASKVELIKQRELLSDALRGEGEARRRALEALERTHGETLAIVRAHNQALETELSRARQATVAVESALADMADLLVARLGGTVPKGDVVRDTVQS
ncbi:MAG: hypothetical protein ACREJ5_08130 [Geminicoccaceae bacterium]